MRTRLLSLLALLLAFTMVAAACGDDDDETTESTTTTAAAEETDTTEPSDEGESEDATDDDMADEDMADEEMTEGESADGTIVDVAAGNEDFSTLVAAVQAAGLVDALSDPEAELTVFAPTNDAFEAALAELDLTADELLADTELLTEILTYHVVDGIVDSTAAFAADGTDVPTLQGATIAVSVVDDGVVLTDQLDRSANVVEVDVEASNGIIHVIDNVILPAAPA